VVPRSRLTTRQMGLLRLLRLPGSRIVAYRMSAYLRVGREHKEAVRDGTLVSLVHMGLVEATDFDGQANIYTLTPEARRALERWEGKGEQVGNARS
jgi:hypothetical protein